MTSDTPPSPATTMPVIHNLGQTTQRPIILTIARRARLLLMAVLLSACTHQPLAAATEARAWDDAQQLVLVTSAGWSSTHGELRRFERVAGAWTQVGDAMPVALGRSGSGWGVGLSDARTDGPVKREGDGRAPAGVFAIGTAFGYANSARTGLPYQAMTGNDWCIDVPDSAYYNRIIDRSAVRAPLLDQSSEPMRRDLHLDGDQRYREGFVIEHNLDGKVRRGGSCIFAHLWNDPQGTTAGCTAMSADSMDALLAWLDQRKHPVFVLLPTPQYLALKSSWNLPEISR